MCFIVTSLYMCITFDHIRSPVSYSFSPPTFSFHILNGAFFNSMPFFLPHFPHTRQKKKVAFVFVCLGYFN